jgi:hypothetical protein
VETARSFHTLIAHNINLVVEWQILSYFCTDGCRGKKPACGLFHRPGGNTAMDMHESQNSEWKNRMG